jgi:hypothetical protein
LVDLGLEKDPSGKVGRARMCSTIWNPTGCAAATKD